MPGARRRGRPHTAWMDNIKTWTGLPVEESIRMTEDRDKRIKYVHGVPTLESRTAKEQNRTSSDRSFCGVNSISYTRYRPPPLRGETIISSHFRPVGHLLSHVTRSHAGHTLHCSTVSDGVLWYHSLSSYGHVTDRRTDSSQQCLMSGAL